MIDHSMLISQLAEGTVLGLFILLAAVAHALLVRR